MSQQVQFQARVAQDDVLWDAIRQPGLVVVDVHSSWCGPCTAIHSVFKRFFYEYSERNIKFYAADCDAIETLANFRGSSQSIFLFFVDGQLQETIFGVVMPEIVKNIKTMTPEKGDYENEYVDPNIDTTVVFPAPEALTSYLAGARPLTPPPDFVTAEEESEEEGADGEDGADGAHEDGDQGAPADSLAGSHAGDEQPASPSAAGAAAPEPAVNADGEVLQPRPPSTRPESRSAARPRPGK